MRSVTFGELIRQKRKELKLPIREVAAQIELDQSVLSKIERNKMQAPARVISRLASCLDIDYESLQKKYWSERIYNEMKEEDYGIEATAMALERLERYGSGASAVYGKSALLRKIKTYLSQQPVEKAWLFGSFARGEESYDSDIDLLVRFDRSQNFDLFDYIGIKHDLEDLTGRKVDLVEEGQELERIKPFIETDKVLIYERETVEQG
jgi:predicted nucleotidyltransferase/plasmid maintenance system antidote protein VapI